MFKYLLESARQCVAASRTVIVKLREMGQKHNSSTIEISVGRRFIMRPRQHPELTIDLPFGIEKQDLGVLVSYERVNITFFEKLLGKIEMRLALLARHPIWEPLEDCIRVIKERVLEFFEPLVAKVRPIFFRPHDACKFSVLPKKEDEQVLFLRKRKTGRLEMSAPTRREVPKKRLAEAPRPHSKPVFVNRPPAVRTRLYQSHPGGFTRSVCS